MIEVKNIKKGTIITHCSGTSIRSPKCRVCGSWINHWENYSENSLECCCLCDGEKEVGAHVKIDGLNGEWIIPTSNSCNVEGNEDEIMYDVDAVSAIQCK